GPWRPPPSPIPPSCVASNIGSSPVRRTCDPRSARRPSRSQDAVMSEREATLGLSDLVRPMLAVPGELPATTEDARWAYELKWDGVRAIAYVRDGATRLVSRNDLDVSIGYPEVLEPPEALRRRSAVLDGE